MKKYEWTTRVDSMITDNEKFCKLDDEIISLRASLEKKEDEKLALVNLDLDVVAETCWDYDIKCGGLTEVAPDSFSIDAEIETGEPKSYWMDYYRNDLITDTWEGNKDFIFANYMNMNKGLLGLVGMGSSAYANADGEFHPIK